MRARAAQSRRLAPFACRTNAEMPQKALRDTCHLSANAERALERLVKVREGMSARAINRLLKVARTIADLLGQEDIDSDCLYEAAVYRAVGTSPAVH